jgi:hypothetical protein
MPDTKFDTFEDLPEMQNEENSQSHINGFDNPYNITPKYTFLTDINRDRDIESDPEENRPLCSPANSLLSTNLESNLGDNQSTDINVSICLFRKNKHRLITYIDNDDLRYPMRTARTPERRRSVGVLGLSGDGLPSKDNNDRTLELEYLSYYMDKTNDNQFGFPSFTYQLDDYRVQEEDDEDVDPFKEACIEHIMKLFSMEHINHSRNKNNKHHKQIHHTKRHHLNPNPNSIDFGYHGMIRHENSAYVRTPELRSSVGVRGITEEDLSSKVIVFFDMNTIEQSFRTSPTHYETHPAVWAVVDEIVRKQSVFHIPINPSIVELFKKNPRLWNISHEGTTLAFPRAMYSVVPSITENRHIDADDIDALYENVETPDYKTATYTTHRKSTQSIIAAPILPFAHSDLFAERFLFTDKPIPSNAHSHFENGLPKYKRFVVFIYNPKFIFSEKFKTHHQWKTKYPNNFVENMEEESKDPENDDIIEGYRNIPCICFSQKLQHHKPVEIWGVIHDDLFSEITPE